MVIIKLLVLGLFIVVGLTAINAANYTPFAPNGFTGIHQGAAIVFFAYIGFDAISTAAEETRNPQRNLPIGILGGLAICTVIYVVVGIVITGMVPYTELRRRRSAGARARARRASPTCAWIVALGAIVSMATVLLVFQYGQPRIFFAMARDGLLPQWAARVDPKTRIPYMTTLVTGVVVALASLVGDAAETYDLTNIGTLFAFALVCAGVLVLRVKEPDRARPFKVPFVWMVAPLGVVACLYIMYGLPPQAWTRFGGWLVDRPRHLRRVRLPNTRRLQRELNGRAMHGAGRCRDRDARAASAVAPHLPTCYLLQWSVWDSRRNPDSSNASRLDRGARRARAQPQGNRRRHPARQAGGHHRPVRLGQVVAGLRHAVRRGAAALRRVAVGLRAAVPRADGEAGRRSHRGAVAGDLDRAEDDRLEPAIDGRHGHRDLRLPAAAVRQHRRAALSELRPRNRVAVARSHRRSGDDVSAGHAHQRARADRPRAEGRVQEGAAGAARRAASPRRASTGRCARSKKTSASIAAATTRSRSSSIG